MDRSQGADGVAIVSPAADPDPSEVEDPDPDGEAGAPDAGVLPGPDAGPAEELKGCAESCWSTSCFAHAQRVECLEQQLAAAEPISTTGPPAPEIAGGPQTSATVVFGQRVLWVLDGLLALIMTIVLGLLFRGIANLTNGADGIRRTSILQTQTNVGENHEEKVEFVTKNQYLVRSFQLIIFIPATLLTLAHIYGITSFILGFSYLADFARPSLVIISVLALGFLFGALFGLPNRPRPPEGTPAAAASGGIEFGDRLEQVADWLTKLLLGAGLTQINSLFENLPGINDFFSRATGMRADEPLGTVLAAGSLVSGFLLGYVSALLFMPVALHAGRQELAAMPVPAPVPVPMSVAPPAPSPALALVGADVMSATPVPAVPVVSSTSASVVTAAGSGAGEGEQTSPSSSTPVDGGDESDDEGH